MAQANAGEDLPDGRRGEWRAALVWFLVAAALRFVRLGTFSLWGDEVYSFGHSLRLGTGEGEVATLAFPLFYALEKLALIVTGLAHEGADPVRLQFVLRVIPALAGAATSAAAFLGLRGVLIRRERHLLAAFLAFSPWFLFFSQTARFYTLVVLFATLAMGELLRAQREGRLAAGWKGAAWLLLAILSQPTALLLLGGLLAAAVANHLAGTRRLSKALLPAVLLPFVLMLPAAIEPELVLRTLWYKLTTPDAGVESASALLLGIGHNFGPLVAVLALLGVVTLWRRDRALAIDVVVGTGTPTALILLLAALGKSVDQRYLLALFPLALVPAAAFVRELADALAARIRGARFTVPVLAFVPFLPGIASEYVDGNRHDLAGAAAVIRARIGPQDGVIAETHALLKLYLPELPDDRLLEAPPPLQPGDHTQYAAMWRDCPRLWIVIPAEFAEYSQGYERSFARWAWSAGRLVAEVSHPRLDYHENRLWVFVVETRSVQRWWRGWTPR